MAVLSGEVKIAMSITGTGDGVAKTKAAEKAVADLEKKVGETTRTTKAASAATSKWTQSLDAVKGSVRPLDGARSVFENLRSNILGFPTAIASVVTGFVSIISAIGDAGSATERLRERTSEYAAAIEGAKKDLAELQKMNGTSPQGTGGPIGADAGDRYQEITDKIMTMGSRIREAAEEQRGLVEAYGEWAKLTIGYEELGTEIVRLTNETAELDALRLSLVNETATAIERQARALREIKALTKTAASQGNVIDLDAFGGPLVVGGRRRGGGGGGGAPTDYDPFEGKSQFMRDEPRRSGGVSRSEFKQLERLIGEVTGRDDGPGGTDKGGKRRNAEARGGIARDIRDFSAALSDALPGMSEFTTALSKIVEIWTKWGQSSISTEAAVVGSLGAIAQAGAMAIKDERARAGVLSIIQLGLGLGKVFIPGLQAEAAGHFAAAATLGSVAIFGSGSGGGRGAGGGGRGAAPTRGSTQSSGEMLGTNNVNVTIHGNYYGGRREQEAASDFARLTRRRGNGFADEGRRSSAA